MKLHAAGATHVGRRTHNEDAFCARPEVGLFAVADGMGGYEGGEVASRVVIDTLEELYARQSGGDDVTWVFPLDTSRTLGENLLYTAVRRAHAAVVARKTGRLAKMGSTVAALAIENEHVVIGHVGDSRVYRLRGGALLAMTRDHSLFVEMRDAGLTDAVTRAEFPHGNVITRALGMNGNAEPEVHLATAEPGDTFVLCSDGLCEGLDDAAIRTVLCASATPASAAEALVYEAFARGGRDNVTAVVVRVAA